VHVLDEHEKLEIDKEIAKVPIKRSACLDALLVVQKHRGYVSDEGLKAVAEYLEMSATELDGIATFYNLIFRKPVGESVIRLCDSVCCFIMGYEAVRTQIKEELGIDWGETTRDKKFTLLPAQCLGTCDKAPAMMIDEDLYQNLTPKGVKDIIKSHVKRGECHATAAHREHEKGCLPQFERISGA
jgi:NADH-quinone oxidoreductase subunit E